MSRENKNKYVMSMCAALVGLDIFEKVNLCTTHLLYFHYNDISVCYVFIYYYTGADEFPSRRPHT